MTTNSAAVPSSTRAAALVAVAEELGARAANTRDAARRTALLGLRCLAAFAARQFALFDRGFANNQLEADPDFPPAFLLEATARQVSFDIDVLLRTLGQRDEDDSTAKMRATLDLADRLAASAVAPAVRHRLIEETAVLTYFQKTPTIRLLPYAPLALIGIDLTAVEDPARLVAVAHEVGHHVYRQLTTNYEADADAQVAQRAAAPAGTAQAPGWLLAWAEEIFADVYGVLVAGPVAGLSVQALLAAELPGILLQDDADHPLPALRPEIAVAVLRKLAALQGREDEGRLAQTAELLAQRWAGCLAAGKVGDVFTPAGGGAPVTLAAARVQLHQHVASLLDTALAPLAHEAKTERWSKGVKGDTALAELYDQFGRALKRLEDGPVPQLQAHGADKVTVDPQVPGVRGGERVVGQIGDPYLDGLRDDALAGKRTLAAGAWKAVFLAGDWVTEEGGSGINPVKR